MYTNGKSPWLSAGGDGEPTSAYLATYIWFETTTSLDMSVKSDNATPADSAKAMLDPSPSIVATTMGQLRSQRSSVPA